jgi:hypothetical protein
MWGDSPALSSRPMARGFAYTATVAEGGPGVGSVDLEILGMSFVGTLEHGHIRIDT